MADMSRKEIEELVADIGQGADIGVYDPSTGGWVGSMLDAERADDLLQNAYVALRQLLNAQKWREIETITDKDEVVLMTDGKRRWIASLGSYEKNADVRAWLGDETENAIGWLPLPPLPSPPQEKENGDA